MAAGGRGSRQEEVVGVHWDATKGGKKTCGRRMHLRRLQNLQLRFKKLLELVPLLPLLLITVLLLLLLLRRGSAPEAGGDPSAWPACS